MRSHAGGKGREAGRVLFARSPGFGGDGDWQRGPFSSLFLQCTQRCFYTLSLPVSREMSKRIDHGALPGGVQLLQAAHPEFPRPVRPLPCPPPQLLPTGPVLHSRRSSTCLTHPPLPTNGTLVRPPSPLLKSSRLQCATFSRPHPLPVLPVAVRPPYLFESLNHWASLP